MTVILSHLTARYYYRLASADLLQMPSPSWEEPLEDSTCDARYLDRLNWLRDGITTGELAEKAIYPAPDWLHTQRNASASDLESALERLAQPDRQGYAFSRPIDLLVAREGARSASPMLRAHMQRRTLPANSFLQLAPSLFVPSPELLFLQFAQIEPRIHAIAAFGCELCGAYALLPRGLVSMKKMLDGHDPSDTSWIEARNLFEADGYVACRPRTTAEAIGHYLGSLAAYTKGLDRARIALQWVKDSSRSPMETYSSLHLRLPRLRGGLHVGDAEFNVRQEIQREWQVALSKEYLVLDEKFIGCNGKKVDVEYNGSWDHSGRTQMAEDNARRRALEHEGYRVETITSRDFRDYAAWSRFGEELAQYLGKRRDPATSLMQERCRAVHRDLCDPLFLK